MVIWLGSDTGQQQRGARGCQRGSLAATRTLTCLSIAAPPKRFQVPGNAMDYVTIWPKTYVLSNQWAATTASSRSSSAASGCQRSSQWPGVKLRSTFIWRGLQATMHSEDPHHTHLPQSDGLVEQFHRMRSLPSWCPSTSISTTCCSSQRHQVCSTCVTSVERLKGVHKLLAQHQGKATAQQKHTYIAQCHEQDLGILSHWKEGAITQAGQLLESIEGDPKVPLWHFLSRAAAWATEGCGLALGPPDTVSPPGPTHPDPPTELVDEEMLLVLGTGWYWRLALRMYECWGLWTVEVFKKLQK